MLNPAPRLLLLILPLMLAACATPEAEPAKTQSQTYIAPETLAALAADDPVTTEPVTPEETGPSPTGADIPPLSARDLMGLEPAEIQALLGPVSLKRWEGEAQVMQFKGDHCVIDIYFYESAPGEAFEASFASARTTSGSQVDADMCLTSILPGGVWAGDISDGGPGR